MYTRIENIKSKTGVLVAFKDMLNTEQSKIFTYLIEEKILGNALFYERSRSGDSEAINFSIWESRKVYEIAKSEIDTELKNQNFDITPDEYYANTEKFIVTLEESCDDDE